jgi:ATP-dependent Lhr-like helicase
LAGPEPDEGAARVLESLRVQGASFLIDLSAHTGLAPDVVRAALWALARGALVTNDQFDVVRAGSFAASRNPTPSPRALSPGLAGPQWLHRRAAGQGPRAAGRGGRWAVVPWGRPEPEALALAQADLLLGRYGVAARELALLDPWLLPWRVLYEVLSRMELAGQVRRGYFVEGLSGAQFARPEAAALLENLHLPSTAAPALLLHSLDPANLYGAGAPFDIPLIDGGGPPEGRRPLLRRPGNWLVLKAGRPVLLAEQHGRKLTALPSASREDVRAATACLRNLCDRGRGPVARKVTVEEWNGRPVTATEGRELLEAAGFVRDYQGMTLYAAWR